MIDYKTIYNNENNKYDILVSHEDYQGNLFRKLKEICCFDNKTVVEFGAGTGRLTYLLSPKAKCIYAFDQSAHMLETAKKKGKRDRIKNVSFSEADNSSLPISDSIADISIEGWSFCHILGWFGDTWKSNMQDALREMNRVTKKGGMMILVETLGTNTETPIEVSDRMKMFIEMLKAEYDFQETWLRTDYLFRTKEEAHEVLDFFFGPGLLVLERQKGVIVPECTGIYWREK